MRAGVDAIGVGGASAIARASCAWIEGAVTCSGIKIKVRGYGDRIMDPGMQG